MQPLPKLSTLYVPVDTVGWGDLFIIPLFARILRSHRAWRAFEHYRTTELAKRSATAHHVAWAAYPQLAACERRVSPILAKSFRFRSDLLLPADACDSIFTSDDDVDDCYRAMLKIEEAEGILFPDDFELIFSFERSYVEYIAFVQKLNQNANTA